MFKRLTVGKWIALAVSLATLSLVVSMWTYKNSLMEGEEAVIAVLNNPSNVVFSKQGKVRFYYYYIYNDLTRLIRIKHRGETKSFRVRESNNPVDTGIEVDAGDSINIEVFEGSGYTKKAYGWKNINADNTCGKEPYARDNVSWQRQDAASAGKPLESIQCWSDWEPEVHPVLDFNDFLLIFSYEPGVEPEPSPESSPESTPTPEASPESSPESTPTPEASPEPSFPPKQPDTGTPTWIMVGLLGLGGLLVLVKSKWLK